MKSNEQLIEEAVDALKLLLEKFGLATTRFIKGEITREHREGIYDEVYRDIRQTHLDLLREVEQKVIGENETPLIESSYPALGELRFDTTQFYNAIAQNKIKDKQRKKLSHIITRVEGEGK